MTYPIWSRQKILQSIVDWKCLVCETLCGEGRAVEWRWYWVLEQSRVVCAGCWPNFGLRTLNRQPQELYEKPRKSKGLLSIFNED